MAIASIRQDSPQFPLHPRRARIVQTDDLVVGTRPCYNQRRAPGPVFGASVRPGVKQVCRQGSCLAPKADHRGARAGPKGTT